MSKRKLRRSVTDSRTLRIMFMHRNHAYCRICQKRAGNYFAFCGRSMTYDIHGSKKLIMSEQRREFRTWKHIRDRQWRSF